VWSTLDPTWGPKPPDHGRSGLSYRTDLQYLAGLFATRSEPLDLELGAFDDELAARMKGRARINMGGWALPTQGPGTVRFVGAGPLEYPEDA
jgi:hypothetical protein